MRALLDTLAPVHWPFPRRREWSAMEQCAARQLVPVAVPAAGALRCGGIASRLLSAPPQPASARARVATLGGAGRTHSRRVAARAEASPSGGGGAPETEAGPRVADVYDTPPELLREGLRRHTVRLPLFCFLACVAVRATKRGGQLEKDACPWGCGR
jgi:hypothetical protein